MFRMNCDFFSDHRVHSSRFVLLQAALLITLYGDEPMLSSPASLLGLLVDVDEALTLWRHRHALMVRGAKLSRLTLYRLHHLAHAGLLCASSPRRCIACWEPRWARVAARATTTSVQPPSGTRCLQVSVPCLACQCLIL